jgi:hypothetical protein
MFVDSLRLILQGQRPVPKHWSVGRWDIDETIVEQFAHDAARAF